MTLNDGEAPGESSPRGLSDDHADGANRLHHLSQRMRDWSAEFRQAAVRGRAECEARRARVLRYVDLRRALSQPPLAFTEPERWSGFVPPRVLAEDACPACPRHCRGHDHLARVNDSPRRAALIAISAEAFRREQEDRVS
jgi:hypothetical protein